MSNSAAEPANRLERVLAFTVAGLVIVSLICFAVGMAGYAIGAVSDDVTGFWIIVVMLPGIALPIALVLTIVLLVAAAGRRSRANRQN